MIVTQSSAGELHFRLVFSNSVRIISRKYVPGCKALYAQTQPLIFVHSTFLLL